MDRFPERIVLLLETIELFLALLVVLRQLVLWVLDVLLKKLKIVIVIFQKEKKNVKYKLKVK